MKKKSAPAHSDTSSSRTSGARAGSSLYTVFITAISRSTAACALPCWARWARLSTLHAQPSPTSRRVAARTVPKVPSPSVSPSDQRAYGASGPCDRSIASRIASSSRSRSASLERQKTQPERGGAHSSSAQPRADIAAASAASSGRTAADGLSASI